MKRHPQSVEGETLPLQTIITDDPLQQLSKWQEPDGSTEPFTLITLVGVEGAAPRPLGAQMIVTKSGKSAGYLSGGCLEQALIHEARDAIAKGENKLLRFGKGSQFIDIKLPCESGLDIYIDQNIPQSLIGEMLALHSKRRPFILKTNLTNGTSTVLPLIPGNRQPETVRSGELFSRVCVPNTKIILCGAGPTAHRLCALVKECGLSLELFTTDENLARGQSEDIVTHQLSSPNDLDAIETDHWSAAILAFHEHAWEIPLLQQLLQSNCFYIGAIGNKKVAVARIAALKNLGMTEQQLAKLNNAPGLIQSAKNANMLALGILTQILAAAPKANQ